MLAAISSIADDACSVAAACSPAPWPRRSVEAACSVAPWLSCSAVAADCWAPAATCSAERVTSDTMVRRFSVIVFMARVRSPISSSERTATVCVRSPAPMSSASFTERCSPREIDSAMKAAAAAPIASAPITIAISMVRVLS
ncbi:hypothetical protein ASF65_11525 [Aureimonas sp. Leaf324]|nr:hypothetical protein ASF65_11525 [Aureimonas sp. Leaf324]